MNHSVETIPQADSAFIDWLATTTDVATDTVNLEAGALLFEQDSPADSIYILLSGTLSVAITTDEGAHVEIDRLHAKAIVGELGIITGLRRSAAVRALSPATLRKFDEKALKTLAQRNPNFYTDAAALSTVRWERVHLAGMLHKLFGSTLTVDMLQTLQTQLTWMHLANGEVVCRQGDASDGMYLIVSGRVRFLVVDADGNERAVGQAEAGETVGEFSLISPDVRSATVQATRETHLVKFTPELFEELIEDNPELVMSITRIIVERRQRALGLRQATIRTRTTVGLMPAQAGVDIRPFIDQLVPAFEPQGTVLVLDAAAFDHHFGRTGVAQTPLDHPSAGAISAWFGRQEQSYDFIIYVPDAGWSPWTERCFNQSDRVLIVGRPGDDVAQGALEQRLSAMPTHAQVHLALWHSAETEHPTGTAAWLAARNVASHYHVREGDAAHFGRLARHLSGTAIGLVLSGGGARGWVHLGVARALEEQAIPVDYIGGTSFGAIGAALLARDLTVDQFYDLAERLSRSSLLFDRTLPIVSIYASRKLNRFLEMLYDDWQIEDLWIPFFAVAANLTSASTVVYKSGSVGHAVRRSISIPGVFAPLNDDGDLIVDGGVMNNFPVDLMRELAQTQRIIGVLIGHRDGKKQTYDMGEHVSGWRVLWRQLNPFRRSMRVPGIANTVLRAMSVNNTRLENENASLVDLLINPVPRGYGLLEFESFREIADIGYEAGLPLIAEWRTRQTDLANEPERKQK